MDTEPAQTAEKFLFPKVPKYQNTKIPQKVHKTLFFSNNPFLKGETPHEEKDNFIHYYP